MTSQRVFAGLAAVSVMGLVVAKLQLNLLQTQTVEEMEILRQQ